MKIQQRLLRFVTRANWILFALTSLGGFIFAPGDFALGILSGGLLVTINFHLLARTLRHALKPPHLARPQVVIAKYYARFVASGFIIFILISRHFVDPLGLFIGLSVVVVSIVLATMCEFKHSFCKEAV